MAIAWRTVEEVPVGTRVSSRHGAQLFGGINERVLSGLGDGAWRMVFWWISAIRQIRNPDASGELFPPSNEFFHIYQHLSPWTPYPETGPGEPEGANLAAVMPAFVAGAEAIKLDPEEIRLTEPGIGVPLEPTKTIAEVWELGKLQRGAYDPTTGMMASPSFHAALSHFSIAPAPTSPHGNSYGGFFPTPEVIGDCGDGDSTHPDTVDYEIRFTRIDTGAVRAYPGTCPSDPTHVARVIANPLGYSVLLNSGRLDYLPRSQWIEGPYSGGNRLSKAFGEHVPRMLNRFSGEFQGGGERHAAEIAGKATPFAQAFDIRKFFLRQYLMAPAYGQELGDGLVAAKYPLRTLTGAISAAPGARLGRAVEIHGGFVAAAFFASATQLARETVIELRQGDVVIGTVTLTPASPDAIVVLESAATGSLQAVLPEGTRFVSSTGAITIEVAELWGYKPQNHDLMLVCRLGGARGASIDGTDGSGLSEVDARGIWESYAANGCIVRRRDDQYLPGSLEQINANAVFDLFRRWSLDAVRIMPRQRLLGYAVEAGKSVLWIDPFANGLSRDARADAMAGIRDAIAAKAPKKGWSNRWCFFSEFFRYKDSSSSVWKPPVLADWAALSDRCVHWTATYPPIDKQLQRHFNFSTTEDAKRSYAPEVAPGYRYALNLNGSAGEGHYRSCRIYEPPIEIESAETVIEGGREIVKVTLTGRLHHHHSMAPASIARTTTTWDRAALTAEAADYRTAENAMREYLLNQEDNSYQCEKTGPGNAAANSPILLEPGTPWGACYPQMFFVKLMPEPWSDGNDSSDANDTVMTHEQMSHAELWLRVLSEGFVDGQTSIQYGCATGVNAVFDFRWETLCYQATGMPWIGTMPSKVTRDLRQAEIRPDRPAGYGPLPTTITTSEIWNQYARILNRLHDVRVMLPFSLETRTFRDNATKAVSGIEDSDGNAVTCPGTTFGPGFIYRGDAGDVKATTEVAGWAPASAAYSQVVAAFAEDGSGHFACGWQVGVQREETEYRFSLVDPDAKWAMPESWRDQLATDGQFLAISELTQAPTTFPAIGGPSPTTCNGSVRWTAGGQDVEWIVDQPIETTCAIYPAAGKLSVPALGRVTMIGANGTPICSELEASQPSRLWNLLPVVSDAIILRIPLGQSGAIS